MSVHYKFKSALDYDTVTFDGLHISVGDLKAAISQQKRIGKTSDFDLQITNAQTKEVYIDDNTLIPKNTSLLVARIPLSQQPKKQWEGLNNNASNVHKDVAPNKGLADLSRMEGSEQDKINAMISQSTFDYDPSNYQKIRGQNQCGIVPTNYICYKCQSRGHWIKDCPSAQGGGDPVEIRRSTGIPRSFMVPVDGPKAPGAMMTPSGTFAVPVVDHEAYLASESAGGAEAPPAAPSAPEPSIPDELICSLCRDLLTDAVMIPCCGNSFCDECIRGALLESEDHECPDCREKDISPATLIPNRFLRNSVSAFRNQTGYSRRTPHRPAVVPRPQPVPERPPPVPVHTMPPNGQAPLSAPTGGGRMEERPVEESDVSQEDNITVTVPPRLRRTHRDRRHARYVPPPGKPLDGGTNIRSVPRLDEQRASTPTVDERRDPTASQSYHRGSNPYMRGGPPQRYNPAYGRGPRPPRTTFSDPYPLEPYQPPPPGIKDSPTESRRNEDPLEAFNRMIREKEERAKRREEEERRRLHSPSPRMRSRSRSRSPPPRPRSRTRSRSPPPPRSRTRSPPPGIRVSPIRASSRVRYSRSRSISRGRRRSPWSPRRRRSRERSLSLTRSPTPRRRHRSPMRYRSPLRSPPPQRSPPRASPHALPRSPPVRSPPPHRPGLRSPAPSRDAVSPQRFPGVYDELLSPSRRSVEPPYGPRYGPQTHGPPPSYPVGIKPIPPLTSIPVHTDQRVYRGRYDRPPPFEEIPPGIEPSIPGYEPSPFEKPPPLIVPVINDRERTLPVNFRESYRPAPYVDGPPPGFRDVPPGQKEIPLHLTERSFRDTYRGGPTGPPYRDQGAVPYRDGQPFRDAALQQPYRDSNFRGGHPQGFRDNAFRNNSQMPFREGGPANYRDNPPHNFRDGPVPFRPPSMEPRELIPTNYHDANFRDGYREMPPQEQMRGMRPSHRSRAGPRRNPVVDHERHRENMRSEREMRDRDRYNENREPGEKSRELDKKAAYERSRDERSRDYDKNREYGEKDRERDRENTPERKLKTSPKRSRRGDSRDKKRSESRGRSRDREVRREKKEEATRDKSSADRSREHKEKDRKLKERDKKKKKREKEIEKKKKREKREKKEKETPKKEEDNKIRAENKEQTQDKDEFLTTEIKTEITTAKSVLPIKLNIENGNKLYGDDVTDDIDKEIIQNYVKTNNDKPEKKIDESANKEECTFDGIELQATADELDLKLENDKNEKEMLAPIPELSKWEVDEDNAADKTKEPGEITSPDEEEDSGKVTSEVIKRAENAIFAKTITSLRPIEIKKISSERLKLYADEDGLKNNIQITVPVIDAERRSVEVNEKKTRHSKTPPRLSVKDRLGGKVDDVRRPREDRIVQSTVELVKSRSKTPKRDQPYRRVTVDRDRARRPSNKSDDAQKHAHGKGDGRLPSESSTIVNRDKKESDHNKHTKIDKKPKATNEDAKSKDTERKSRDKGSSVALERERKRSTLDEAHFEPDYDETVESDTEAKEEIKKKRERSKSQEANNDNSAKKVKTETETIQLDLANVKKKPETASESSSGSDSSSSSSSEELRKRKRKKKRAKRKKKRAASDSDSDSGSSSDDHKKKKKKRKHKKKSSKKKKKSKHK